MQKYKKIQWNERGSHRKRWNEGPITGIARTEAMRQTRNLQGNSAARDGMARRAQYHCAGQRMAATRGPAQCAALIAPGTDMVRRFTRKKQENNTARDGMARRAQYHCAGQRMAATR